MVGRESKGGSVFSWADEVEKEEEAAATAAAVGAGSGQAQLQQRQKPSPFGSARPREVVLQEKGIDWRKLDDLHLQQPSPSLHESKDEKLRKQSNPQPATTMLNSTVSSQAQVFLTPQIQSPILFVPPLRYPPKYVAGFLYEPGVSTAPNASGYQHYKLEKENKSQGVGKSHNSKSESAMCGNTRTTTTELVQAKEAQKKGRSLGECVVYGNKPEEDSAPRKENFHGRNSLGLPLVNQNIGPLEMHHKRMSAIGRQPRNVQDDLGMEGTAFKVTENEAMEHKWQKVTRKPEMHDKRMSANGRQPRNIQDDLGMDGTAFKVTENNKAMEHKWQKVTRKPQDLSVKQVNTGGRDTAHSKMKGDRPGLGRNNKKNFKKKEIKLQT